MFKFHYVQMKQGFKMKKGDVYKFKFHYAQMKRMMRQFIIIWKNSLNSTMFRWNSFIFLPPPWRWGRLNSTMFRWNEYKINYDTKIHIKFKFHYVQMEQHVFWLILLHLIMFKFHYVQMERGGRGNIIFGKIYWSLNSTMFRWNSYFFRDVVRFNAV